MTLRRCPRILITIAVAALGALWRFKVGVIPVIGACAALGAAIWLGGGA